MLGPMTDAPRSPPPAVYLGLDTATPWLALALWRDDGAEGEVLARSAEELGRAHAARLMGAVDALLRGAGVGRGELAGIGVGVGPGSYTGVRVGLAAALGMGRGLGVPVAGGDTLAALAVAGLADGEAGAALLDARRGNVYCGVYRRAGLGVEGLEPPAKRDRDAFLAAHPGLARVEGAAPDAALRARAALRAGPAEPLYL